MDNTSLQRLYDYLGKSKIMILATSTNNVVSASTISVVCIDGKFCFQTDSNMQKARK